MTGELWVCPFGTCTEEQAQLCRVHLKGCVAAIPDDRLAIAVTALESVAADSEERFIRGVANAALREIGRFK